MRRVLRGAIPLLTAAALGLTRPAPAQTYPSAPAALPPAASKAADDAEQELPRVAPPHRLMLEPLKDASLKSAPASNVVPASAQATPAPLDLLSSPTLPQQWLAVSVAPRAPVVPSGLPAPAGGAKAGTVGTPPAAAAHGAAPVAAIRPAAHAWPTAFVSREATQPTEVEQTAYVEKTSEQGAPSPAPDLMANRRLLEQRVEAVCGRDAVVVAMKKQPDGSMQVMVRVRDGAQDHDTVRKVVRLLTAAVPNVHILLDVQP